MLSETSPIITYITPWDQGIPDLLRGFLDGAAHKIRFITYGTTLPHFFEGLVAAHQKGIDIAGILDHTQACGHAEKECLDQLFEHIPSSHFRIGTSIKAHQIVHLKACSVDSARVWSGSWNFSTSASDQVNNVDIIISQARAKAFDDAFDHLWGFISTHEPQWNQNLEDATHLNVPPSPDVQS